jgi:ABC-type branched-subunit amino acid transport system substrate-binding protein
MDPDVATTSDYVIRLYEGVDDEASAILKHFESVPNPRTVDILYARVAAYEKVVAGAIVPALGAQGKHVAYVQSYPIGEQDFTTAALKLRSSGADDLIVLGYGFEYPALFKSLKEYSVLGKSRIIGGWGFLYTTVDPALLKGVLVSVPEFTLKAAPQSQFWRSYMSRFGDAPNFDAMFAYNAIRAVVDLAGGQTHLGRPLKPQLAGRQFEGIIGPYTFDKSGNMVVRTALGVHDGLRIVPSTP